MPIQFSTNLNVIIFQMFEFELDWIGIATSDFCTNICSISVHIKINILISINIKI